MRIFLDMDGVLADFTSAAVFKHGRENPWAKGENLGEYDMAKIYQMTPKAFWEPLGCHDFWANIQPLNEGMALLKYLESDLPQAKITLLTSPTLSPECSSGKHAWVAKHLPKYSRKLAIWPEKEVLAEVPNSLLIDDSDENVTKFIQAGGNAILWPQPWNSAYHFRNEKDRYFAQAITKLLPRSRSGL